MDFEDSVLDMFDMFSSKPGQINNNQTPANNPFLETNQVSMLKVHYFFSHADICFR